MSLLGFFFFRSFLDFGLRTCYSKSKSRSAISRFNWITNWQPLVCFSSRVKSPPSACASCLLIVRPIPLDVGFKARLCSSPLLKYGLNKFLRSSGLMPRPLSITLISKLYSPSDLFRGSRISTVILSLGFENLMALLSKLMMICYVRIRSTLTNSSLDWHSRTMFTR